MYLTHRSFFDQISMNIRCFFHELSQLGLVLCSILLQFFHNCSCSYRSRPHTFSSSFFESCRGRGFIGWSECFVDIVIGDLNGQLHDRVGRDAKLLDLISSESIVLDRSKLNIGGFFQELFLSLFNGGFGLVGEIPV